MRKTACSTNIEAAPCPPMGEGCATCLASPEIVNLGMAENRLIDHLILPFLQNRPSETAVHVGYAASYNDLPLRTALASLYREDIGIAAEPSQFMLGCGISFLIERIGLVLCEPGNVVLIPRPCHGVFAPDLQMSRATIVYIDLDALPPSPRESARLLILTDTGNPIGDRIADPASVLACAYRAPIMHILVDDIYALSNRRGEAFRSMAARADADSERVHQVYGASKDWDLAGCHGGFFWTRNEDLLRMMRLASGAYHMASDTQFLLASLLGDTAARQGITEAFRTRLVEIEGA